MAAAPIDSSMDEGARTRRNNSGRGPTKYGRSRFLTCLLLVPFPMNSECLHCVPKRKRVTECRISLTFREIVTQNKPK